MVFSEWLRESTELLSKADVATARLDCLVIAEHVLATDRARLLAEPQRVVTSAEQRELNALVERRKNHEPVAYIIGQTEFYGRTFALTPGVLEPRPESETMIQLLLEQDLPNNPLIADIGCGSGALGITAALELPGTTLIGTDTDQNCIALSKDNAKKLGVSATFYRGSLLEPVDTTPDAILANMPYVPTTWNINRAAQHEPKHAIFGGQDGMDLYRQLFAQITTLPDFSGPVLTECLPPQQNLLRDIATEHGLTEIARDDFIQVFYPASRQA